MTEQRDSLCTKVLIGVNVICFLLLAFGGVTEDGLYLLKHGASYTPYVIENKEYYRLFTSMFLHFDINHLLGNMVTLGVIGVNVEPLMGKVRFIIVYLLSGLSGNVVSLMYEKITEDYAISAGASGAIFGLTGALLALVILNKGRIGSITKRGMMFMIGFNLYLGFTSEGVDNFAHLGGLIMGMFITLIFAPKKIGREEDVL